MSNDHLFVKIMITLTFLTGLLIGLSIGSGKECVKESQRSDMFISAYSSPILIKEQVLATITAYNTVPEQTDNTPCLGAGGNICGRNNVVACPRSIPLGTWVIIDDTYYECLDRLAVKYDDRFDISFDKDIQGAKEFGKQNKEVLIIR